MAPFSFKTHGVLLSQCIWCMRTGGPILIPLGLGIRRIYGTSLNALEQKTRQIGLNHDHNMTFLFRPVFIHIFHLEVRAVSHVMLLILTLILELAGDYNSLKWWQWMACRQRCYAFAFVTHEIFAVGRILPNQSNRYGKWNLFSPNPYSHVTVYIL